MRITTRIRLTVVVVVSLVLLSALAAFESASRIRAEQQALSKDIIPFIEDIERLRYLGTRSLASAIEIGFVDQLGGEDDEGESEEAEHEEEEIAEFQEEAVEPFEALVASMRAGLSSDDDERRVVLDAVTLQGEALLGAARELIELVEDDEVDAGQLLDAKEELEDHEDAFIESIGLAIEAQHRDLERRGAALNATLRTMMLACAIAAALVVVIGAATWSYQSRSVVAPLRELERAAGNLAEGDLDTRVQHCGDDEIGQLGRTFNQMAEALKRSISSSYLNKLIDSIPDPLLVVDDGCDIVRVNPVAQSMLGTEQNGEKPKLSDVLDASGTTLVSALVNTRGAARDLSAHMRTVHGTIPVTISAGSLGEDDVRTPETVIIAKDMSDWNRTVAELERSNRQLNEFAYIASHDLKSPLRAIANLSEWIQEDLGDNLSEEVAENMQLMRGRVHRMESLIQGILEYSRIGRQSVDSELLDSREVVEETIEELPLPEGFNVDIEGELPRLRAPRVRFAQVFANLIGNAVKYHDRPDGQIKISATNGGNFYTFSIADDGPGIDPQYHEKVFAIFQTLVPKDTAESTGIGLALVKRIVEEHGGEVELDSDLGRGATFRFSWPVGAAA